MYRKYGAENSLKVAGESSPAQESKTWTSCMTCQPCWNVYTPSNLCWTYLCSSLDLVCEMVDTPLCDLLQQHL